MLMRLKAKFIYCSYRVLFILVIFLTGCATSKDFTLYNAIYNNQDQYAMTLIETGSNLEVKANENGWRPILLATSKGKTELVEKLLIAGADPNVQLKNGLASLHFAAQNNQTESISLLIEYDADLNRRTEQDATPLYDAASRNKAEATKLLLEAGADFTLPIYNGWTPLSQAAYHGYDQIVKLCTSYGAKHNLFTYAATGDLSQVKALVKSVKDTNRRTACDYTPLHFAAANNRLETASFLLDMGADIDISEHKGFTPLHSAVEKGKTEMVALLLRKGANVNFKANDGATPLNQAATYGKLETIPCLLKNGAELDAQRKSGDTPLYDASFNGHFEVVRYLITKGADVEKGHDPWTPLCAAADRGYLDVVKVLLGSGRVDIDSAQENGTTALYRAALRGYLDIAMLLLEAGADLNIGYNGWAPLHAAAENGHLKVAELLLDYGASLDAVHLDTKRTSIDLAYDKRKKSTMLGLLTGYYGKKTIAQTHQAIKDGNSDIVVGKLTEIITYYEGKIQEQASIIEGGTKKLQNEKQKVAIASVLNSALQQAAMSTGNAGLMGQTTANEMSARNRKYSSQEIINKAYQINGIYNHLRSKYQSQLSCVQTNTDLQSCF